MIVLKNIRKENNYLLLDYYPELCKPDGYGFIKFDIDKLEVSDYRLSDRDKKYSLHGYYKKTVRAIKRLLEQEELPESYVIKWY